MAKYSDLDLAFGFVSSAAPSEHSAFLCLETGICYWYTEIGDNDEPLPDDVEDSQKYIEIPHKNDLGLGKQLALNFAAQALPEDFAEVADVFRRRGAYAWFKHLLERRGKLDEWYEFEGKSQREALLSWCESNGIDVEQ